MARRNPIRSSASFVLAMALCLPVAASSKPVPGTQARIVNGVPAFGFPAVGALLYGANGDTASTLCSGTLIGCETFLTAAHCVESTGPGFLHVFLPHAGIFDVTGVAPHPSFAFPAADVAVLKLAQPVNGVGPMAIDTLRSPPFGSNGTIVGYGRSGSSSSDYGLKRAGSVMTDSCVGTLGSGSDASSVCWTFQEPLGIPGSNSNTCNGDSGGPLLIDLGSGPMVAGVTSGGSESGCEPTDRSYDANVYTYRAFIASAGGVDLANTTCGTLAQVGGPRADVSTMSGTLSALSPEASFVVTVAPGTEMLRVALNAVDDYVSDFDLYVRAGSPASVADYDCRDDGPNQYGFCELAAPTPGSWYVLVRRYAGSGAFQLTATTFSPDCAGPGTDGAPCDDGNPCTGGDVCQAGACTGSPDSGTACDDGNACTASDVCQTGSCAGTPVANGTSCDDGSACTQPDVCQAGTCTGNAPALACKPPVESRGSLLDLIHREPAGNDTLLWSWKKGTGTVKSEFGDPTTATGYALCLYDQLGAIPEPILEQAMLAGAGWRATGRGFRYQNRSTTFGAIRAVRLNEGADGKAALQVKGKGGLLALPPLPLGQSGAVRAQLLNGTSCWEAVYSSTLENGTSRFKARSE